MLKVLVYHCHTDKLILVVFTSHNLYCLHMTDSWLTKSFKRSLMMLHSLSNGWERSIRNVKSANCCFHNLIFEPTKLLSTSVMSLKSFWNLHDSYAFTYDYFYPRSFSWQSQLLVWFLTQIWILCRIYLWSYYSKSVFFSSSVQHKSRKVSRIIM